MDTLTIENVNRRLLKLFEEKMSYDFNEDYMDMHFFSSKIGMQPRHLLYLYFFIEEEFDIRIPQDCIISEEFSTFSSICNIILRELQKKCIDRPAC